MCEILDGVLSQYDLFGNPIENNSYGFGHINKTMKLKTEKDNKIKYYIVQKINTNLFTNVDALMSNIEKVSLHLQKKCKERNGCDDREVLKVVKTKTGKLFSKYNDSYYRIYDYIEDSVCLQSTNSYSVFEEIGGAFGQFQSDLNDFDASSLETILPDFHNTSLRYEQFLDAVNNYKNFDEELNQIIENFASKSHYKNVLVEKEKNKTLPLRVTHNDTKLNNIALDKDTFKALAVLDLDTVMPSTLCYDYGDAIRYGVCTCEEDEEDERKVDINLELLDAYTKGYLSKMRDLTKEELNNLSISPLVISYELGLRFLTDYLTGNKYFKTTRKNQNLDRAKVQYRLLLQFEKNFEKIDKIINKYR